MLQHEHVRHSWYAVNLAALVFSFFGSFWIVVSAVYAQAPATDIRVNQELTTSPVVEQMVDKSVAVWLTLPVVSDKL